MVDELEIVFCFNDVVLCNMIMCIKVVIIEFLIMLKVCEECVKCDEMKFDVDVE